MKHDVLPVLPLLRMKVPSPVSFSHPWNLSFFRFTFTWVSSSSILIGDCLAPLQAEYFFPQSVWFKVPENQNTAVNTFKLKLISIYFFSVWVTQNTVCNLWSEYLLFLGLTAAILCTTTVAFYLQELGHFLMILDIIQKWLWISRESRKQQKCLKHNIQK